MGMKARPFSQFLTKKHFVRRITDWMMPDEDKDPELAKLVGDKLTLDSLYTGRSARIHVLVVAAYLRGVRRGAGLVWDATRPVSLREVDEAMEGPP